MFDHVRFDFGIRGIIIYDNKSFCTRVSIIGYPYVRNGAVNDNKIA